MKLHYCHFHIECGNKSRQDKEKSDMIAWIESQRPKNTRASYNTYGVAFLKYAEDVGLDPKSPITLASFMKSSLERGLSGSINSSITSAATLSIGMTRM